MREAKHAGPRRPPAEKLFSLYPLTLEEVADRMLATPPSPRQTKPAPAKAKRKP